jgi:hypothetical protein
MEAFMRKLFISFLPIFMVILSMACQTVEPLDPDTSISMEIVNIPSEYIGWTGLAGVHLDQSTEDPQLAYTVDMNVFSGILKYKNGNEFKVKDVRRNSRYIVIFILVKEGEPTVTRYSKQLLIKTGTIFLDFAKDFYPTPEEALRHYL